MSVAKATFFDCCFVGSADEIAGTQAYAVFQDDQSDPFLMALVTAIRGEAGLLACSTFPASLPADAPVFVDGPTWERRHDELAAAGVRGDRARVVLYFSDDPTGHWDFAKALGDNLGAVFLNRALDKPALKALQPFLELWLGGRAADGRLLPMPGFTVRDYAGQAAANAGAIHRILARLADDESRATYARMLFGDNEQILAGFIRKVFGPQQYMELVQLKPGDVIINCGVNTGPELAYFGTALRGEGRIYNIDPVIIWEGAVYGPFIKRAQTPLDDRPIILGETDGQVELAIGADLMVQSGEVTTSDNRRIFTSQRLDTFAYAEGLDRIDYVKMDVEGGELSILRGGMETVKRFRPKLAVAIYHQPRDFWEYPLFLMERLEGYRYYVRQYGYGRFETLLYAIPEEEGAEGPNVDIHLRDRPPGRAFYGGTRRVLNRCRYNDWSSGLITPSPRIDTDLVPAVFVCEDQTVYLADHDYGPSQGRQLVIGRAVDAGAINWIISQSAPSQADCAPVLTAHGAPGFCIRDPETGQTEVRLITPAGSHGQACLKLSGRPILVEGLPGAAGWRAYMLGVDGRGLTVATFPSTLDEPEIINLELPGTFEAFCDVRRPNPAASPERGLALRTAPDWLEIGVIENGRLVVLQALAVEKEIEAVSTFTITAFD
jgi:FkbM family methyltransferase